MDAVDMKTMILAIAEWVIFYIPAAIICIVPVMQWMIVPPKKVLPLFFSCLTIACIVIPFLSGFELKNWAPCDLVLVIVLVALYFMIIRLDIIKLIYLLFCDMAALSFGGMISHLVNAAYNPMGVSTDYYEFGIIVQLVINLVLVLLYTVLLRKKLIWVLQNFQDTKGWILACMAPAAIAICNMEMVPRSYQVISVGRVGEVAIIVESILLILFIVVHIMFYVIAKSMSEKYEIENAAKIAQMQSEHYEHLEQYIKHTRRLRHDFKHTIYVIEQFVEKGEIEELRNFIKNYYTDFVDSDIGITYCNNLPVNALLNHYTIICREKDIAADWKIELSKDTGLEDVDFCVLIGNLLENAVCACDMIKADQRYIKLSIDQETEGSIYIMMENSFDGNFRMNNGYFLSVKKDHYGIGLSSIKMIAEKYHGVTEFYSEDDCFYSNVMLKTKG